MKKMFIAIVLLLGLLGLSAKDDTPQERYVKKYADMAVKEMVRSGVPASITLAQGILESGSGMSKLATQGNNHFGIKCHKGWEGKSMKVDDDAPNECFRVYSSVADSYKDHSDFLRYRDRYKFLFDLERTDYKGWAYGLKKAGYATDPGYPAKLIKYIEEYKLYKYDVLSKVEEKEVPLSPLVIEAPKMAREEFHFPLTRELFSKNGVPFVYSLEGETYRSIAKYYHLFHQEILRFNDLRKDEELLPGTVVYLSFKENHTQPGLDKYIIEQDGEDFHAICQRFAVKEKAILKLNGWKKAPFLAEGDEIKLR
ncbi:MAG: LysM peptidoglycan-binding domain-containing protein [Bacteroidales bacterium]|nr:LysM peptidoglycan-binding domain-containing protein [Bacteroidales bacterium]